MHPVSHLIKTQFLILCRNGEKGDIHYGKHTYYLHGFYLSLCREDTESTFCLINILCPSTTQPSHPRLTQNTARTLCTATPVLTQPGSERGKGRGPETKGRTLHAGASAQAANWSSSQEENRRLCKEHEVQLWRAGFLENPVLFIFEEHVFKQTLGSPRSSREGSPTLAKWSTPAAGDAVISSPHYFKRILPSAWSLTYPVSALLGF